LPFRPELGLCPICHSREPSILDVEPIASFFRQLSRNQ
jgi:hypothetical protein